tara:strand:+ start:1387 stop:2445 length:1059 start_codon:yes stop_codon:yes gene_type:complete
MKKLDWKKTIIKKNLKIKDAVKSLISSQMQICLVIDLNGKFYGTITDGDIRRGFLKGYDLNTPILKIIKKKSMYCNEGASKITIRTIALKKSINHIPILDKNHKISSLYSFQNTVYKKYKSENNNLFLVMAGGFGKRLLPYTKKTPKPLLEVRGKPLISYIIKHAKKFHFKNFYISTFYLKDKIKKYFRENKDLKINPSYIEEKNPLGTAGCLYFLKNKMDQNQNVVVCNSDIITKIDYSELLKFHDKNKSDLTMVVKLNKETSPYGVVNVKSGVIVDLEEKPDNFSFINLGIYVLSKKTVNTIKKKFTNITDLVARKNSNLKTIIFPINEDFLDFGKKEVYLKNKNLKIKL